MQTCVECIAHVGFCEGFVLVMAGHGLHAGLLFRMLLC